MGSTLVQTSVRLRRAILALTLALTVPAFAQELTQEDDAGTRMVRAAEAARARQMTGFDRADARASGGIEGAIRDAYATAPGEAREQTPANAPPKRGGPLDHPGLPWLAGAVGAVLAAGLLARLWKRLA